MKFKVYNLERDMKLLQNGAPVVIKRAQKVLVSQQDYQYLAQVYGTAVKREKEYTVRVTTPTQILTGQPEPIAPVKKRKSKKR